MSDLLKRIADYFKNDYQGDDKTAPTMEITVNDLRYIANMNVDKCRAEAELRNLKYNKCKDCAGCIQCKADEANAIKEYIDKVVKKLEERKALYERLIGYESKNGTSAEKYQHIKAIDVLNDAIEIIKAGGING